MTSKLHTITLPVRGDGKGDNVLAHAAALARQFEAHVKVIHCHPKAQDMMPFGVVIPSFLREQIVEATQRSAGVTSDQLHDEFVELAKGFGLSEQAPEPGKATARFVSYEGKQVDAVRQYGRLADLICVPQPDKEQNLGANTLKSALFSSGRPVMLCPPRDTPPDRIGAHVAIGWNGSLEASRAVALSMPLIEAADAVTVLSTGDIDHVATAEQFTQYLARRGVSANIHKFKAKGTVGRQLLQKCDEVGADLLIMGAYHDSYERETVFGGNSQAVVDEAKIPVVLVH